MKSLFTLAFYSDCIDWHFGDPPYTTKWHFRDPPIQINGIFETPLYNKMAFSRHPIQKMAFSGPPIPHYFPF